MSVPYIQQCLDLYRTTFPGSWIVEYNDADDTKLFEGYTRINNFYKQTFILLSKAVLCGEYAMNHRYKAVISIFLREIAIEVDNSNLGLQYAELNGDLKESLSQYYHLLTSIDDKIINNEEEYYFKAFKHHKNDITNQYPIDFISLVIELATIDHFFTGDKDNRISLILIQKELNERVKIDNEDLKQIYCALLDKCNFLLKKIFYDQDLKRTYRLDSETYRIDDVVKEHSILKDMSLKYDYLYDINNFPSDSFNRHIREYQDNCFRRNSNAHELILLMKHYKKDRTSPQQASNLLSSFNSLYDKIYKQKINGEFNLLALNSIKNYLYNSQFAISLLSPDYSFESLKNDIEGLEGLQSETHIYNYFPFYKGLAYLSKNIKENFNSPTADVVSIEEKINYYNCLISKYKLALEWSSRNKYYPFQLLYNECIAESAGIKIFVASSFARPINYGKLYKKLDEYKLQHDFLKYQLEIVKEKHEINKVKESVKGQEKKNFEYLGVFIAIITFLFASISIFTANSALTLQDSLLSILSLGAVLVIFVLLLKAFQSSSTKTVNGWFIATLIIFTGLFICLRLGVL